MEFANLGALANANEVHEEEKMAKMEEIKGNHTHQTAHESHSLAEKAKEALYHAGHKTKKLMHVAKEMLSFDHDDTKEKEAVKNGELDEDIRELEDYENLKHEVVEHEHGNEFERKDNTIHVLFHNNNFKSELLSDSDGSSNHGHPTNSQKRNLTNWHAFHVM